MPPSHQPASLNWWPPVHCSQPNAPSACPSRPWLMEQGSVAQGEPGRWGPVGRGLGGVFWEWEECLEKRLLGVPRLRVREALGARRSACTWPAGPERPPGVALCLQGRGSTAPDPWLMVCVWSQAALAAECKPETIRDLGSDSLR